MWFVLLFIQNIGFILKNTLTKKLRENTIKNITIFKIENKTSQKWVL